MSKKYGTYADNPGSYHIADNPELYEIQRTNNFEFVVTNLDGIVRAGTDGTGDNDRFANAQEVLRFSVSKAFVPHFQQGVIPIKRGNNTVKFAGVPDFPAGSLSFRDYIGAETKDILMAWQNLSYNVETERVGSLDKTNYKRDCYLIEYTPDYRAVRKWVLKGCWISKLDSDPKDHDGNNAGNVSVTIEYDRAFVDNSDL